jgi:hypothetical protein
MKKWYKSRTIAFNALMAALVALEASLHQLSAIMPVNWFAVIAVILPIGNAILRVISTTGIEK